MNEAVLFDMSNETRLRPNCIKCSRIVQAGVTYVRYDTPSRAPTVEFFHEACAPLWMVEQAKQNEGKRRTGQ